MSTTAQTINQARLDEFMGRFVGDLGAALSAALVVIGDRLGLYQAMADGSGVTPDELARRTGTDARYVREWLSNQAAGGYVNYADGRFSLTPEQSLALAQEGSPAFVPGAFQLATSLVKDEEKISGAFHTGHGVGWHEHHHDLFAGTERFFRPGYAANLISSWIPALDGVQAKLESGALVADVGCGHGASTLLMAEAFPSSEFVGFDYHEASIEHARRVASEAGLDGRVSFEVAPAKAYPGDSYDLVAMFDCLHDMGDPVGAAAHVLKTLDAGGTWMIVEPYACDRLEDNLNPVGRVFYGASTLVCTPASRDQEVGLALGAQAGEARLRDVVTEGGFTRFRRATETPFNIVLEARP
jgi:SAM-dependent methyltransferase